MEIVGVWTDWEAWWCLARGIGEGGRRLSGVVGRLPVWCGFAGNMIGVLTTGMCTVTGMKLSTSAQLDISSPRVKDWLLLSLLIVLYGKTSSCSRT